MFNFIITFAFIFYTTSNAVSLKEQCTCAQIKNRYECMLRQTCIWSENICQKRNCTDIIYTGICSQTKGCYVDTTTQSCQPFTNCDALVAKSQEECLFQSIYCGLYDTATKQCSSLTIAACTSYKERQECLYSGQGQLCYWNAQGQCQDFNCSLIQSQQDCQVYQYYCTWEINNNTCIPAKCENLPTSQCTLVLSQEDSQINVQPCYIDQSDRPAKCKNAALSDLTPVTCSLNSFGCATWNNVNLDSGSCQYCYEHLIQIISITLIILIQ